jgi:hypothetical protein
VDFKSAKLSSKSKAMDLLQGDALKILRNSHRAIFQFTFLSPKKST